MPLYRQKFPLQKQLPSWIKKKQCKSRCYREQFPIDLSRNITAHRAQGQTWKNQLVSVDLGLASPNNHIPPDIGSVIYVACTRTNMLQNLFVSPIFPTVWENIGKLEQDKARRKSEEMLKKHAEDFAREHGWLVEFWEEVNFVPDYSGSDNEWKQILSASSPPALTTPVLLHQSAIPDSSDVQCCTSNHHPFWVRACERERHIGLDQGYKNFAMVAVDKVPDVAPMVVGAELYNLESEGLNIKRFDVTDLILLLQTKTALMNWMQHPDYSQILPRVDRVIVHLEQLSVKNKLSKQFGVDLGRTLQRLVDIDSCVVKLSQPHIHREGGPMFKLGKNIIHACNLNSEEYTSTVGALRKRLASNRSVHKRVKKICRRDASVLSDVEPDSSSDTDIIVDVDDNLDTVKYRRKKRCLVIYLNILCMLAWSSR